jgi:hypothetical protein
MGYLLAMKELIIWVDRRWGKTVGDEECISQWVEKVRNRNMHC